MKELIYPSTYHAMKDGPCLVGVCKHDGKCWLCEEYGILRRYAARDADRIHELRAIVKDLADALSKFHAWKEARALVAKARKAMTPIELKKLRSTKKEPKSYVAYMPPFRSEWNAVLDNQGFFVVQFMDREIFMANGKAYNIAEVVAEGVNMLVESEVSNVGAKGVKDETEV